MEKILVIEDETNIAKNIKQILELSNFYTITAEDGDDGVELAKEEIPDLILCDVMMPKLDGYQVIAKLKKEQKTENIPLIFLTAKSDRPDFRKGMELGADDYLTKPFTPEELLTAVKTCLARHQKIKQRTQAKIDGLTSKIQKALPHELYTPLNGIMASASLLKEYAESLSVEEIKELAQMLLESSEKLQEVSEKFIFYSYLELILNNPKKLEQIRQRQYHTLPKNLIETVAKKEAINFDREEDLVLELQEGSVKIADIHLQRIVRELINNAFKFSRQGQQVKILGRVSDENSYNILIINEGSGMMPEQLKQIGLFQQFHEKLPHHQGCGLGIAIARKLTEIYQSSMGIESFADHQTIIHIILPND